MNHALSSPRPATPPWRILAVLIALFSLAPGPRPAQAQITTLSNVLLSGLVRAVVTNGSPYCEIDAGQSTFKRNFSSATSLAEISFSQILLAGSSDDPTGSRVVGGQAYMNFTTTTSGGINFPTTPGVLGHFTAYQQFYNATTRQVVLHFNLELFGCTIPVVAVYRD